MEMYSVSICYYLSIYATFARRNFDRSNSFVLDLENRTISNLSLRLTNNVTFVTREMVSFLWVRNLFVRKEFIALFGDVASAI